MNSNHWNRKPLHNLKYTFLKDNSFINYGYLIHLKLAKLPISLQLAEQYLKSTANSLASLKSHLHKDSPVFHETPSSFHATLAMEPIKGPIVVLPLMVLGGASRLGPLPYQQCQRLQLTPYGKQP